jgi:hypothetical protein
MVSQRMSFVAGSLNFACHCRTVKKALLVTQKYYYKCLLLVLYIYLIYAIYLELKLCLIRYYMYFVLRSIHE